MLDTVQNIGWSMVFSLIGGFVGMVLVLIASLIVPGLINRLTPDIDEHKEIVRGNTAVAEYYSRIVGAVVIGLSLVVAAAVLGGVIAALH